MNATALNGPHAVVGPLQTDFGNLAIGKSASQTVTVANDGDAPMQIQQAFMVTGTPSVFPITADGCSGQVVNQGSSCQFTVRFEPTAAGFREGSVIIIIINNTPAPVTPIGFTGTGVPSPNGTATITGNPAAASTLTCNPVGNLAGPSTPTSGCATGKPSAAPQPRAIRRVTAISAPSSHVG